MAKTPIFLSYPDDYKSASDLARKAESEGKLEKASEYWGNVLAMQFLPFEWRPLVQRRINLLDAIVKERKGRRI